MAVRSEHARAARAAASSARIGRAGGRRLRTRPAESLSADERDLLLGLERRRVREVSLFSLARVSVCFYLCALVAVMTAAVVLWIVASAFGVVGEIESFMDDLGFEGFRFISGTLFWAGLFIGLAVTAILVVMTVFAAALYNVFADVVGGVDLVLEAPTEASPSADDLDRDGVAWDPKRKPARNGSRRDGRRSGDGARRR